MLTLVSAMLLLCGEQEGDTSGTCDSQEAGAASSTGGGESFEDRLNEIVENVMHSRMMEELKALPSEVIEELKNLPGEIRESLILHVERRSLVVAGVVVAIGAALLLLGCVWIHWCHTEHGEYRYIPISQVEEFLRYQNVASSSSSAQSQGVHPPRHRHKHSGHSSRHHKDGKGSEGSLLTHRKTDHGHIANGSQ